MSETPDDLTTFVDAEIFIEGEQSPSDEKEILALVADVPGIVESQFAHGRLDIRYDPTQVNKHQLVERVIASGRRVKDVQAAASSPIVDLDLPT